MKIVLVHNAKSGSALSPAALRKKCAAAGLQVETSIAIGDGFEHKLRPHIKKRRVIAVVGGDGTISAVAGLVAHTKATLLPLPGGTLNHFTKDLGVPQDIDQALAGAKGSKSRAIDIAKVNDLWFINNSSLGLYPQSLKTRQHAESFLGKWPAAAYGMLRAFVRYRTYTVTIDGKTFDTPFIFVGNNDYQLDDGAAAGRTTLRAGTLSVYAVKASTRRGLARLFLQAATGRLRTSREFVHFTPQHVTIKSRRKHVNISHDGEVSRTNFPLAYDIHAGALRVIVPGGALN